jgi:hypothetical protein
MVLVDPEIDRLHKECEQKWIEALTNASEDFEFDPDSECWDSYSDPQGLASDIIVDPKPVKSRANTLNRAAGAGKIETNGLCSRIIVDDENPSSQQTSRVHKRAVARRNKYGLQDLCSALYIDGEVVD